jgi:formate-dependent nitrite reductase membrane component NrfD
MAIERQTSWGRLVALAMFLGGTGAGIYVAGFIMGFISGLSLLVVTSMVLGPVLVIAGLICLLMHSGTPLQAYRLFKGLSKSWMSRGGLLELLFIVLGFGYTLPGLWFTGWLNSIAGIILGSITLVLALVIAAYHGVLLAANKGIPFWSSSVMPLLSFIIALSTGLGLLLLLSPVFGGFYSGKEMIQTINIVVGGGVVLICGQLLGLWSLMSTASRAKTTGLLRTSIFASVSCVSVALLLLLVQWTKVIDSVWTFPVSGLLLLAGGFIIRDLMLRGGYYVPLKVPMI